MEYNHENNDWEKGNKVELNKVIVKCYKCGKLFAVYVGGNPADIARLKTSRNECLNCDE